MLRLLLILTIFTGTRLLAQPTIRIIPVDSGWAKNSVNAVVFRKNSLTSFKDTQYISFYNSQGYVVVGKRKLNSDEWTLRSTPFHGNAADAHNSISIMVDGGGYLHISWDHHNTSLKYARSIEPGSLEFATMNMTDVDESRVSYPEFYRLPNGNLLFFYRSGESGQGQLVINEYNLQTQTWAMIQRNLLDGESQRNAYWQACVDDKGIIHLSWVWRESPDVASNHDLCYARSNDQGRTWTSSDGIALQIPITAGTAEYIKRIPQQSELINQTSITTSQNGFPFIATYWRDAGESVPQYHIVFQSPRGWQSLNLGFRHTAFSLSGGGTKSIPVSRPQIIMHGSGENEKALLIFRDLERKNRISIAIVDMTTRQSSIIDVTDEDIGAWEPSFDTDRWKNQRVLNLFVQRVHQADAEGLINSPAEMVSVLEWAFND